MKHERIINSAISRLHKTWMDENDKNEFDAEIIRRFGEEFDSAVDTGIANGFTEEQQEKLVQAALFANIKYSNYI